MTGTHWATTAVTHVRNQAHGEPIDPTWRVTLHFHPDRATGDTTILRAIATDSRYRSQFEIGTSNGGMTAHPGGDRWNWESRLFSGAYDQAPPTARPVYGSLNHRMRPYGGSPRFGSAHLRLNTATLTRTTLCYPDSVFEPVALATTDRCALIELADTDDQDLLDDYIEAHVHGGVILTRDAEALVLDPSFRNTEIETDAHLLGIPVQWHQGFQTDIDEIAAHPDYRGPEIVKAATRIAQQGLLNPRIIGEAVHKAEYDPQTLKRVWHYTARFGHPGKTPR
ncbi:DUF3626 domain-containing protein [Actinoplanes couchii]|uniref:DUF3626 domain-containing protein n=1 Tax=Actinoplanes couchii TaxID=403638 RepID=A0ABQ3XM62_9ACTN|nr:DUF3626 domain-containing protein [Actinoplanes couchii]MDR6319203.1 hypothetical protein [Actinoplanes couchii]GID59586.1 hypothetical protein Aco03nite_079900 [Actinoplanes couchii]